MHLTYSEIHDQYRALNKTIDRVASAFCDVKKLFDKTHPRSVVIIGCGASRCIADSLAPAAQAGLNLPATAIAAGDFMLHPGSYTPFLDDCIVLALSRSGATTEVLEAARCLKGAGAPILSITALEGSPLAALSDITLEMPWCADKSVCQTRAASCLYLAGMLLLAKLGSNTALAEGLERAVSGGPSFMEWYEDELKFTASKMWKNVVLLADAELYGIAEEGALAFGEICRRQAVSSHLLEYRHGAITLAGRDTLVITAISDGNQYELDLVADVAKRGADLVVYSDIPLDSLPDRALNVSFGKSLPHPARGLPFLLIAQLIAYHRAVADGVNPDEPEGLRVTIKL
jgi:glutamine---fructose-6-phosphate transaminase (isomerizing)